MEGLVMHGAAHVFFENKLEELTIEMNGKIRRMDAFVRKELQKLHLLHMKEIKKLKTEINVLKDDIAVIKKSEDDISHTGFNKLRRLSKDVNVEMVDIKKIKGEVLHLKEEITDIKHHEDDITHVGMHQITKMNKEMKSEVKHLKSHIKCLKRDLMSAKETPRHKADSKDTTDLRIHTLKMNSEEVEELLSVKEAVHAAYNTTIKAATAVIDVKSPEDRSDNVIEAGRNALNLWITSNNAPSVTNDDLIQLSQSVILYVKAPRGSSPTSSNPASIHWSSQEDVDSAPLTRNSSFEQGPMRSCKKGSSGDNTDEDDLGHNPPSNHIHHNIPHVSHIAHHLHHAHLEDRRDSIPLTPVQSEDEEVLSDDGIKINKETKDEGLTMRIDKSEEPNITEATKTNSSSSSKMIQDNISEDDSAKKLENKFHSFGTETKLDPQKHRCSF